MKVWLDGNLLEASEARISPLDRGLLYGDGLFETLRAYRGKLFLFDAHLERLVQHSKLLGLAVPPRIDLRKAMADLLRANALQDGDARVRVTVTRGPSEGDLWPGEAAGGTTLVTTHPIQLPAGLYERGAAAMTSRHRVLSGNPKVKSTSFQAHVLAKAEARRAGCWEAFLLNERGEVAEGATSNIFALLDGALVTPRATAGILPGITRSEVLRMAKPRLCMEAREASLRPEDLAGAREIFLTSSIAEVVPVVRVDGHAIGDGFPGPVTRAVVQAYRDVVNEATH